MARASKLKKFGRYVGDAVSSAGTDTVSTVPTTITSYYVLNKLDQAKEKKDRAEEERKKAMSPKDERHSRINALRHMSELQDIRQLYREPIAAAKPVVKVGVSAVKAGQVASAKKYAHAAKDTTYKSANPYEDDMAPKKPLTPAQKMAQPSTQMTPPTPRATSTSAVAPYMHPQYVAKRNKQESAASFPDIADFIKGYFNNVYQILSVILMDLKKGYKSMRLRQAHTDALKQIVFDGFMDYRSQLTFQRVESQLQKISLRFDRFDPLLKKARNEAVDFNKFKTAAKIGFTKVLPVVATALVGIGSAITFFTGIKRYFKSQAENKRKIKQAADSNEKLDYVFTTSILPELEKVLDEVFSRNITSTRELALRLYRIMDLISSSEEELKPYLTTWKPSLTWTA